MIGLDIVCFAVTSVPQVASASWELKHKGYHLFRHFDSGSSDPAEEEYLDVDPNIKNEKILIKYKLGEEDFKK